MKLNYVYCLMIFQFIFLGFSCVPPGGSSSGYPSKNVFLTNGYEYDVLVYSAYEYNNATIERYEDFFPGMVFAVAARHKEYSHIIAIRIETLEGKVLAEYTPEYLESLRKIFIKKENQHECWIFTEKGLFFETEEIDKRFNWDSEKILAYYRSDEAVHDLQTLLKENLL